MNSDIYIAQGHGHSMCQDYALNGVVAGIHYAIGSDGCSSSPDSDVGSRLLCFSAKQALVKICQEYDLNVLDRGELGRALTSQVVADIALLRVALDLPLALFDATLSIVLSNGRRTIGFLFGDGNLIIKYKNRLKIVSIEYESNAPFYLSYNVNERPIINYHKQFAGLAVYKQEITVGADGSITQAQSQIQAPYHYCEEFITDEAGDMLVAVTVCSDGIQSYFSASNEKPLFATLASDVVAYKNYSGEFVQRRMQKLQRDYTKAGLNHYDDIFCAAISFI